MTVDNARDFVTPLMAACTGGHVDCVRLLLQGGADVSTSVVGRTALVVASLTVDTQCLHLMLEEEQTLANIDAKNANGWTALMFASYRGYPTGVEMLLYAGASTEVQSDNGTTALFLAAFAGKEANVSVLLAFGAKDSGHVTANGPSWTACVLRRTAITCLACGGF